MGRLCLLLGFFVPVALLAANEEPSPLTVHKIRILTTNGGRVDWSPQNKIAFDRRGKGGFYDIWVINPDGSDEHCLTCDQPEAPKKNKGNPAWHPSGQYIVFQGQKDRTLPFINRLAEPGRGVANDLWLMDASGQRYWKLVDVPRLPAGGILHPHFSHDGKKLIWVQLVKSSGKLGQWELKMADFELGDGNPRITNTRTFTPGPFRKFYETHDFGPENRHILFTSQVPGGLSDIFQMDVATGQVQDLTNTPDDWDEHAQYTPDGRHIVWASSRNQPEAKILNLWIMNRDGSNPRVLHDFHAREKEGYTPGAGPADSSWSPDGKALAVYVISSTQVETEGQIWILDVR